MEEINFHVIKESDYRFLYELLTQRRQIQIFHTKKCQHMRNMSSLSDQDHLKTVDHKR